MDKVEQVWTAALGELQLQMTKATFDTWVRDTQAVEFDDSRFVIGVKSGLVRDWLEDRLGSTIERTLTGILGYPVQVTFLVIGAEGKEPGATQEIEGEEEGEIVAVRFYEFDPMKHGFLMTPKYCEWFWQPYLGVVPYATYRFLRSLDRQNEGWGEWHFVTVERIAATVADGSRQAITGVQRKRRTNGGKYWQKGAFDRLTGAGIARIETLGSGRKNVSYRISCLNALPLLVPEQVETLAEVLQLEHAKFLEECSIEYEEWQQLELPTLVQV